MKSLERSDTLFVREIIRQTPPEGATVNSGGLTNLLAWPFALYDRAKHLAIAIRDFDIEASANNVGELFNTCLGVAYAANKLAVNILSYLHTAAILLLDLQLVTSILGWVFMVIETLLELGRLYRLNRFEKELNLGELDQYNDPQVLLKKLATIHCIYFRPPAQSEDQERVISREVHGMVRILRPWLVEEIHEIKKTTFAEIALGKPYAMSRGIELLRQIQTQIDKTRKVYYVGLLTLALAMATFGLALITSPYIMPLYIVAFITIFILEFARWFAPASYLDQKGYIWSWDPWIPEKLGAIFGYQKDRHRQPTIELVTIKG